MIDPVDVQDIAKAALMSGGVVFFGACYAVFYALAMLGGDRRLHQAAYAAYAGLALCTAGMAVTLHLGGWWLLLVATLLVGYFAAPRGIWRLCTAVHAVEQQADSATAAVSAGEAR